MPSTQTSYLPTSPLQTLLDTITSAVHALHIKAQHLGHGRILTTDERDFGAYRFKQHHPFDNLPLRYI